METQLVYVVWALLWRLISSVHTHLVYWDSARLLRQSSSTETQLLYGVWALLWSLSSSMESELFYWDWSLLNSYMKTQLAYGDSVVNGDSIRQWRLGSSMETQLICGVWILLLRLISSVDTQLVIEESAHLWRLNLSTLRIPLVYGDWALLRIEDRSSFSMKIIPFSVKTYLSFSWRLSSFVGTRTSVCGEPARQWKQSFSMGSSSS